VGEALPGDVAAACVACLDVAAQALDAEQTVREVFEGEPSTCLHGCPGSGRMIDRQRVVRCASCATRGAPGLKLSSAGRQSLPPSWITSGRGAGLWCAGGSAVGTVAPAGQCILTAQTELGQHARIAGCVGRGGVNGQFMANGYRVISGPELHRLKTEVQNVIQSRNAPALATYDRRAVLLAGMLLRDSPVAQAVRRYLLEVESVAPHRAVAQGVVSLPRDRLRSTRL
jgi:hypothetical protein